MNTSEIDLNSPAIKALGSRFKLTEVYLRFKYDDDEDDDCDNVKDDSAITITLNTSIESSEESVLIEDGDLFGEMSALGLPLSFQTSKQTQKDVLEHLSTHYLDDVVSPSNACDVEDMAVETTRGDLKKHIDELVPKDMSSELLIDDQLGTDIQMETKMMSMEGLESGICNRETQVGMHFDSQMDVDNDSNDINISDSCDEWGAFWDSYYLRYYFYNTKTQESTWYPPPGMEEFGSAMIVDTPCVVNGNYEDEAPNKTFNNNAITQLLDSSSLSSSVEVEACNDDLQNHVHTDELETVTDELCFQETPTVTKQKKKRKNRRRKKSFNNKDNHELEPVEEYYVNITKYWCQRYLLFSKFDDGIQMDEEGWFSVTPETIAKHHASRVGNGIIADCFAGVGGNIIQFAKTCNHVIAIDIDPKKIDYALNNAAVYGVEEQIEFINGDCFTLAPKLKADTIFLSPPWGGPDYLKVDSYDMNMLQPHDGKFLFDTFKVTASLIIMFLPRNVDIVQLAELCLSSETPWSLEVEKNFLNEKLKAVTAYFRKIS
ncbi:Trimethylguanosine synthase [Bienertia sinuspersici]